MQRRGLSKLFRLAKTGNIHTLIITHKGRLTRFGMDLLERILNVYGSNLKGASSTCTTESSGRTSQRYDVIDSILLK